MDEKTVLLIDEVLLTATIDEIERISKWFLGLEPIYHKYFFKRCFFFTRLGQKQARTMVEMCRSIKVISSSVSYENVLIEHVLMVRRDGKEEDVVQNLLSLRYFALNGLIDKKVCSLAEKELINREFSLLGRYGAGLFGDSCVSADMQRNPVQTIIENDDFEKLYDFIQAEEANSEDYRISADFTSPVLLRHQEMSLIQYSAFVGASKCFRFLYMKNGGHLGEDPEFTLECIMSGRDSNIIDIVKARFSDQITISKVSAAYFIPTHALDPSLLEYVVKHDNPSALLKIDMTEAMRDRAFEISIRNNALACFITLSSHYRMKSDHIFLSVGLGALDILQHILQTNKIDFNVRNQQGHTVLHHALLYSDDTTVIALAMCPRIDLSLLTPEGLTYVQLATQQNRAHLAKYLLS